MISIVVPCFESTSSLVELVRRIHATLENRGEAFELILVNDGSNSPEVWEAIEALASHFHWIRGIDVGRNIGQAKATLIGMRSARGDFVVTMDDDLQHAPEDIPYLLANLAAVPDADCVMAAYKEPTYSEARRFERKYARLILRSLYGMSAELQPTSFRILRREFAQKIRKSAPLASIMAMMLEASGKVITAPVKHHTRERGAGNYTKRSALKLLRDIALPRCPFIRAKREPLPSPVARTQLSRKRVLILGLDGPNVEAIHHLKQTGCFVAVCAAKAGAGAELADEFRAIDLSDVPRIVEFAKHVDVQIVYSIGARTYLPIVAAVSRALCLPMQGSFEIADLAQDPIRMCERLKSSGIATVHQRTIKQSADLEGWDVFPAMLTPVDGGRLAPGIQCGDREELAARVGETLLKHPGRDLLLRECGSFPEVAVLGFVNDGELQFLSLADRQSLAGSKGEVPTRFVMPSRACSGNDRIVAEELVRAFVREFRVTNGPINARMAVGSEGPRILEIATGLDSDHLWRLVEAGCGVNLLAATFQTLVGESPDISPVSLGDTRMQLEFCIRDGNRLLTALPIKPMHAARVDDATGTTGLVRVGYAVTWNQSELPSSPQRGAPQAKQLSAETIQATRS